MNATFQPPVLPDCVERKIERPHGKVHTRSFPGAEPAFALLHGFPDNSKIYDYLIPHLVASGCMVVTLDFLDFGDSEKPPGMQYSFAQQLEDLEIITDSFKLAKVTPVGHDSSGPAAINFALKHSDRTAAVVLLNTFYYNAPGLLVPEIIDFFSIKRF